MNQTKKMAKKSNFELDFRLFWLNFGPKKFFRGFYLY